MEPNDDQVINIGPDHGVGFVIQEIWLAVADCGDGDEGIPAISLPNGMMMPLVAADPKRLTWLRQTVRSLVRLSGKPIRIVRMQSRELVETFHPDGRRESAG